MSEEVASGVCCMLATPKHREVWRNIALVAWIFGIVPGILAVVVLNGVTIVFAVLVSINVVFLVINCSFCCVNIQTLTKKRTFYIICFIFMIVNDAVLITSLIKTSTDVFQIIGYAGCGLVSISCTALVILISLLFIQGPYDPVAGERNSIPEPPEDLPDGYVAIRYVSLRRSRLPNGTTFQVQAGQVLSLPQQNELSSTSEQICQGSAPNSRRGSFFSFRSRSRAREEDARNMPIRIISDGIFTPQRRDSAISLLRRTSTGSVEYDTGSVRCICFYSPNTTVDNDEEVPSYSETPTGNISACPIHGINSITPPPYEGTSAYNTLCSVLGLPKYDDLTVSEPCVLSAATKLAAEHSTTDTLSPMTTPETAATRVSTTEGTTALLDRFLTIHTCFETILEDRSEENDSNSPEEISWEPIISTPSSNTTDIPSTQPTITDVPLVTAIREIPLTTTTDVPLTSTTNHIPPTRTATYIPPTRTATDIPPTRTACTGRTAVIFASCRETTDETV